MLFQFLELSTAGCWHQLNTNRNLGCGEENCLVQTAQCHSRAVRSPWGDAPLQLDSSALLCLVFSLLCAGLPLLCLALPHLSFSALVQGDIFNISAPARETQSLVEMGKCAPWAREELTYRERSPYSWFLISMPLCKWRHQILEVWLVWKALSFWLIGQNEATVVSENANEDIATQLQLDRESLSPTGWNTAPGTAL